MIQGAIQKLRLGPQQTLGDSQELSDTSAAFLLSLKRADRSAPDLADVFRYEWAKLSDVLHVR